ncbi:MAG: hypothetical protein DYH17_16380, partial [Xanthomonadales bacterium PRO6]|nr:hypothetical protein [Xanthomonadales bacterium PRO6]
MALDPRLDAEQVLAAVACDWLRPLQPEDRAFHHALYADPDNMRWLGGAIAPTAADAAFAAALAQLRRPAGAA